MKQVALVTGGSRGIGRAIAERLALDDFAVGILYHSNQSAAEAVVEGIRRRSGTAVAVRADVAEQEAVTAAVEQVAAALGEITLLVNNAGIAAQQMFQDITAADWRRMMAVHVDGAFYAIQAVLPAMLHRKTGSIVNLSSMWGLRGASCEVSYATAKAAIIGMTRSLAVELAPSGIRVNCVAPGVTRTEMVEALGEETLAGLAEETPLGRLGMPAEIADAVAFLAGGQASFITGQVLTVDGGLTV